MAFILRCTKLIHGLAGFSSQRGLIGRRKNYFFLRNLNAVDFSEFPLRTTVSLAATENKEREYEEFEKSLFQLSKDIQNRSVFIEDIQEVFNSIKQRGEITYPQIILLLKCCSEVTFMSSNNERIKLAEEIWKTASEFGTKFHISHYNALLNVFLENSHEFSPSEFLSILESEGIEPNLVTYRRILRAHCQQGNIEGANGVLEKMKELDLPMSEEDFNSLILGYCEAGDLKKAQDTLKIMQEKDIDPSSKTYTHLLCGYAKQGEIEKMKALLKELPQKDIVLSEYQLLEIVYVLAVNDKTEHIDFILQELSNSFQISKAASRIIQRLLHVKMDSVALRIFEQIERTLQSTQYVISGSKKILKHFVVYRSPNEILDLCHKMEVKGWLKTSVAYALRETFIKKNEEFCLQLLDAMRSRGMEVRIHYYWPAIIKASEKGNSHIMNILKTIPRNMISDSFFTVAKVILPNFRFGEDWRADLESLASHGIKRTVLARCFLEKLLSEGEFDKAENIASTLPVSRPLFAANYFARLLPSHPQGEKHFVNILYCLAHDFQFSLIPKNQTEESAEELAEEANRAEEVAAENKQNLSIFDYVLPILSRNLKNEEDFRRILEGMLEKKMAITPRTASLVADSLASENLVKLVNKLADPELKFEMNDELVNNKKYNVKTVDLPFLSNLTANVEANLEILSKEFGSLTSMEDQLKLLRQLVREQKVQEAVLLAEQLLPQDTIDTNYLSFVFDVFKTRNKDLGERAFEMGVEKGILDPENRLSLIRWLFGRGHTSEAVDMYCDFIEKRKKVPGIVEFLNRIVPLRDEVATKKVLMTMSKYMPEHKCLSHLTLALARDGQLKKAKKLLESKEFRITERNAYVHLEITYKESTTEQLENSLKILKDLEDFDRIPLYKLLLRKYANENDVAKAKELWLLIEEDDISNYDFLEQMREFINNPTVDSLKSLSSKFETVDYSGPVGTVTYKNLLEHRHLKKAFSVAMTENLPHHLVNGLIDLLAAEGKSSEVVHLVSKYKPENPPREMGAPFLQHRHVKEYLEFLNHYAADGNFKQITDCLRLGLGVRSIQKDEEAFALYKSLAMQCYENTQLAEPLLCYFTACVCTGHKLTEAESMFEQYSDQIKGVAFSELKKLVKPLEVDFLSNLLASDKLRSHYSDQLPAIFSNLIVFFCTKNKLNRAVEILNTAVTRGIKNAIDKDSLSLLERKLLAKGQSFPYPELLESET